MEYKVVSWHLMLCVGYYRACANSIITYLLANN